MRRRLAKLALVPASALLAGSIGCTHNHYYYTQPGAVAVDPCAPAATAGTTVISSARPIVGSPIVGSVCDDPPQGSTPSQGAPAYSSAGGPIGASPVYRRPVQRPLRRGGLAWRSSTPENLATLKVEGAYDDETQFR